MDEPHVGAAAAACPPDGNGGVCRADPALLAGRCANRCAAAQVHSRGGMLMRVFGALLVVLVPVPVSPPLRRV